MIFVKTNFVEVLRRELDKPSWTKENDRLRHRDRSVSADRRHLQDSRAACSKRLRDAATPVGIVTKGPMIVRDNDVLQDLSKRDVVPRAHQRADGR